MTADNDDGEEIHPSSNEIQNAWLLVGAFFDTWGHMEAVLNETIRAFFRLPDVAGEIIIANLSFRQKTNIIRASLNLHLGESAAQDSEVRKAISALKKLDQLSEEWRNVVAHTAFVGMPDLSVRFLASRARGKLDFPQIVRSRSDFLKINLEISDLSDVVRHVVGALTDQSL